MKHTKTDKGYFFEGRASDCARFWLDRVNSKDQTWNGKKIQPKIYNNEKPSFNGELNHAIALLTGTAPIPKQVLHLKGLDRLASQSVQPLKRVRELSDTDGDFDLNRRWEIKPFNSTRRIQVNRQIQINVWFGFVGEHKRYHITAYGELVFALTQAIERMGYQVGITLINRSIDVTYSGQGFESRLIVKAPNEYQDLNGLYRYFTPEFYRRAQFNLRGEVCEGIYKDPLDWNIMGKSRNQSEPSAVKGAIDLTPGMRGESAQDLEKLKALILTAING